MEKYVTSGFSAMTASAAVHPVELIKTRMQVDQGAGLLPLTRSLYRSEGVLGFYAGLSAALLRQATYGTTRIGLHREFSHLLDEHYKSQGRDRMPWYASVWSSMGSAFIGVMVGNPCDLALVRMSVDTMQPPEKRQNYRNPIEAITRVARQEGVMALWKGCGANIARAMAMNTGQMASFDIIKRNFKDHDVRKPEVPAAFCAGVICATASLPFDYAKSQMQKSNSQFKSIWGTMMYSVKHYGFFSLWTGYLPFLTRVCPHAVITLLLIESTSAWWKKNLN